MVRSTTDPGEPIHLFGPEMLADPYTVYHRLRAADPVYWHEPFGAWLVTGYDDVVAAFHDPRFSSLRAEPLRQLAASSNLNPFFDYLACRMDFQDPPRHTRLRSLANKVFTPRAVESLAPHIQDLVNGFLDRTQGQGRMDVIRDLAYPLPGTVIAELLGVPVEDGARLKAWADTFVGFFKTVPSETTGEEYRRSFQAAEELGEYYRTVLARAAPGSRGGLLLALQQAEVDGDRLSWQELSANVTLLLHAGHETTTHLIGNGLLALLRHPRQLQQLRTNPERIPAAVEEFLRYDSPVQFTYRIAREDFAWQGKAIRQGQIVHLLIGAANRDPAQFPDPDQLDGTRQPNKHLSFGYGPHFCLGAPLARLEAQTVFRALLARFPTIRLEQEHPPRQNNFVLRGLQALPIAFSAK